MSLTVCLQKLYKTHKGCKLYYEILNKNDVKPNCCSKWEDKLQRNIPWQTCFLPLNKIYDVNMKWFKMGIMHRIIGTSEMGVTTKNKCSFHLIAKDTIQHIVWECTHSQQIWTWLLVLLNEKCTSSYRLRLSDCLILFWIDDIRTESGFNFILRLAKQYLCKCKNKL